MFFKKIFLLIFLCFTIAAEASDKSTAKEKIVTETLDRFEDQSFQGASPAASPQPQQESPPRIDIAKAEDSVQQEEEKSDSTKANEENHSMDLPAQEGLFKKHTPQAGTEISYIQYREPGIMKERGAMYGLTGSYTYHNKIMAKLEGRFAYGKVDYKNSGEIKNINDYIGESRGLLGYDFIIQEVSAFTPYAGIGYRYLNDDMSGKISTTGAAGYERESNYLYSPIGLGVSVSLNNGWALGGSVEYDYFWWGKQISHLSNVNSSFNNIENKQKKGYGIRGSLQLLRKSKGFNLVFEPFIRYWDIKQSENADWTANGTVIGYGYEPKNNSTEIGGKLALEF